ncbi:MerR family transcriptional regulator [Virgibacillus ainsalahensis]
MKTLELLGINGLCHIVGISENTAADWIKDFNVYIPKADQQDATYYHPEAIEVLKFIKQCKDQNYAKPQIMDMLANRSFPITVDSSIEDVKTTLEQGNYKENILSVMQTIGMTVSNVANQEKWLKTIQEQQYEQNKRIKHTEKQTEEINHLKREIQTLKQELTNIKENEIKKETFVNLFKKSEPMHLL